MLRKILLSPVDEIICAIQKEMKADGINCNLSIIMINCCIRWQ